MTLALISPLLIVSLLNVGQPVPDVKYTRVAKSVFPRANQQTILAILDRYGINDGESQRERVQIAALKLAEERKGELLEYYIRYAGAEDYRDVLGWAEYPEETSWTDEEPPPRDELERIRRRDRTQYLEWLLRHVKSG